MLSSDASYHRKTEAGTALAMSAAGVIGSVERLEDPVALGWVDTGTMIDNPHEQDSPGRFNLELDARISSDVMTRIRAKVQQRLMHLSSVRCDNGIGFAVDKKFDPMPRIRRPQIVDDRLCDMTDVDGTLISARQVLPGEFQHVGHQPSQPIALVPNAFHGALERSRFVQHVPGVEIAVSLQCRERCSQLVGDIGQKTA